MAGGNCPGKTASRVNANREADLKASLPVRRPLRGRGAGQPTSGNGLDCIRGHDSALNILGVERVRDVVIGNENRR